MSAPRLNKRSFAVMVNDIVVNHLKEVEDWGAPVLPSFYVERMGNVLRYMQSRDPKSFQHLLYALCTDARSRAVLVRATAESLQVPIVLPPIDLNEETIIDSENHG